MQNAVGQYSIPQGFPNINIHVTPPKGMENSPLPQQVTVNGATYVAQPSYPSNYYMNNLAQPQVIFPKEALDALNKIAENTKKPEAEKVEITDEYMKTICDYLMSEKEEHQMLAAKTVIKRLEEDKSRKNNPQLTACINKMLQDGKPKVRVLSLAALNSGIVDGDETTKQILQNISQKNTNYGEDAISARSALLRLTSNNK